MSNIRVRLEPLEQASKSGKVAGKPLFDTVDDDMSDEEMERLRALGRDPIRWTDALEQCI